MRREEKRLKKLRRNDMEDRYRDAPPAPKKANPTREPLTIFSDHLRRALFLPIVFVPDYNSLSTPKKPGSH